MHYLSENHILLFLIQVLVILSCERTLSVIGSQSAKGSILMGFIFIPGGAMEIVVATLALDLELIVQSIFVAIVFAALASSILAGPLIGYQTSRMGIEENTVSRSQ